MRHDNTDAVSVATRSRHVSEDRKSTRLNSSHGYISYAVFCLKKKNYAMSGFTVLEADEDLQLRRRGGWSGSARLTVYHRTYAAALLAENLPSLETQSRAWCA